MQFTSPVALMLYSKILKLLYTIIIIIYCRAVEMQQEFAASLRLPEPPKVDHLIGTRFLMDPRLRRDATLLTNSEHLVGTVEKTLSFLGYEDRKPESITPAKRKVIHDDKN